MWMIDVNVIHDIGGREARFRRLIMKKRARRRKMSTLYAEVSIKS